jgi:tRNA nucleotidyltransferase/poly(A) polymerase
MKSFAQYVEEMRYHNPMPIPPEIRKIHQAFKDAGKKLYVVGGAVRDHLLGKTPKDLDLATDAPQDQVQWILDTAGIKRTDTVGQRYGVVVANIDGVPYEIATFREDLEKKRDTKVRFSNIEADAKRRDLTINALYYDLDTDEVIDLVGGVEDLRTGNVRTVGNAAERFGEDAIRVLRFIRFYCRVNTGGLAGIDKETQDAIHFRVENGLKGDDGKSVAAEAIKDEFLKGIKSAKSSAGFLELYDHFGLLTKYIFPGLHVDQARPNSHNPILVIAGLLHKNSPEQIARRLLELKYSNDEIGKVEYLVNLLNLRQGRLGPVLGERPHYLYGLRKSQPEVSDEDLETWAKWHGLDSQALHAFRQHTLKNRQDVPGAMDVQGTEIGKLITHHNTQEMLQKLGFREWLL